MQIWYNADRLRHASTCPIVQYYTINKEKKKHTLRNGLLCNVCLKWDTFHFWSYLMLPLLKECLLQLVTSTVTTKRTRALRQSSETPKQANTVHYLLRTHWFACRVLQEVDSLSGLFIPSSAVHQLGCCSWCFVQISPFSFNVVITTLGWGKTMQQLEANTNTKMPEI